jgi:hypothetical protein
MISAKAGFVNYADGQTNLHLHEQVTQGASIETGAQGHAELLLTPGSFLRVGSDSTVIFDSVELSHVAVRLVDGTALIEVAEIDKHAPISVTSGNLRSLIASRGVYRFSGNTASVVEGKLRIVDAHRTVKKGHQITSAVDGYIANSFSDTPNDDLDRWSQNRSAALANANAMAYHDQSTGLYSSLSYDPYWNIYGSRSSWIYSSLLGGFTFIPRGGYRSYYGYSFVPISSFGPPEFQTGPGRPSGVPVRPGSSTGSPSRPRPIGGGVHAPIGGHAGGARSGGHGHR